MTNKRYLIAGNWKMTGDVKKWQELAEGVSLQASTVEQDVLLCPPAPGLLTVADAILEAGNVYLGAQDVHAEQNGAFTGDISVNMLNSCCVNYALVGHSERRQGHKETNSQIAAKAVACLNGNVTPVVCIGETEDVRAQGNTLPVLKTQLSESLGGVSISNATQIVIAYEPVWAIGTGKNATEDDLIEVFAYLRSELVDKFGELGYQIRMLYGGSVKPDNTKEILNIKNIDGVLVGGASLDANVFGEIIRNAPLN